MGNWSLSGIILIIGVFFTLTAVLLGLIDVENPIAGMQTSVWEYIFDLLL